MSYDGYEERQAGMSMGAKIAIALVAVVGVPIVAAFGYGIYSSFMVSPETRFERAIAGSPEAKGFVTALRTRFQGDYSEMHDAAIRAIVEGGGEQAAQRLVLNHLRTFSLTHKYQVAHAPDEQLAAFLTAQAASGLVSARYKEICRAGQSLVPEKLPKLGEREKQVLESVTVRFVEAAAAGRDHPVQRKPYAYSDQQVLIAKMQARGYSLADLEGLGRPVDADAAMMRKCAISSALVSTLAALPRDQGLRIFAHLLGGPVR